MGGLVLRACLLAFSRDVPWVSEAQMYRSRFLSSLRIFSLQELLPEILGNMSDTLLVEANKMEAKDEKFISQGIYNMLYGTVELLIVSAEASRVTGDGETLSTNRSRVGVYIHSVWLNGCTLS